ARPGNRHRGQSTDLQRLPALGTESRRYGFLRSHDADHVADHRRRGREHRRLPPTGCFWRLWSKRFREPSEIIKMTLGFAFSVGALLSLTGAAAIAISGRKASIGWVLAFEVL